MSRITASLVVLLVALLPGCGPSEASAQERIAQAPAATQSEQSALMSMEMVMTGGQEDVTITAEGGVDFANERSTMTLNMGDQLAEAGFGKLRLIMDGTIMYMEMPNAQELGLPTAWVKMDLEEMTGAQGLGELQQMGNDPTKSMEMLQGVSDDVTEVGAEDVRGEPTTHYRATVDLEKARDRAPEGTRAFIQQQIDVLGTSTMPLEVWLDDAGRLRRQRVDMDLSQMAASTPGAPTHVTTTVEMFDFGAAVDAEPPPADEVSDFADLQGMGG
jgi:hypothetical protein